MVAARRPPICTERSSAGPRSQPALPPLRKEPRVAHALPWGVACVPRLCRAITSDIRNQHWDRAETKAGMDFSSQVVRVLGLRQCPFHDRGVAQKVGPASPWSMSSTRCEGTMVILRFEYRAAVTGARRRAVGVAGIRVGLTFLRRTSWVAEDNCTERLDATCHRGFYLRKGSSLAAAEEQWPGLGARRFL